MQIPNGSMRLRSNVKYQLLVGSPKHFHVHQRTAEDYQHVAFSEWQSHGHQAKGDPVDTSLMSSCSAWIRSTSSTPSTSFFFFFLQVQILQGWKRKPRPPLGHPSPSQSCQDREVAGTGCQDKGKQLNSTTGCHVPSLRAPPGLRTGPRPATLWHES